MVIFKLFIVAPLLLLLKVGISEVFSLVKTLVKNSFSIVAFLMPMTGSLPFIFSIFQTVLEPDQGQQNVGPHLDPNCLDL